jgi:hypothetical protein
MKTLRLLACLLAALTLSSCDALSDLFSPCGSRQTFDLYLLGSSIVSEDGGVFHNYMEGDNRVFQWSDTVENVCAEEHVKGTFRVALLDETTTGISARGRFSWQFLFEEEVAMTRNGSDLKGNGEAGLRQAFGEDPGWFIPTLEVYFPTRGSFAADTSFLKANVISVEMEARYRNP